MLHPHIPVSCRGMAVRRLSRCRGVGLIDATFAIVIVAVGVVAVMQFMASASTTNIELEEHTTGMALATSAMEMATEQDFTVIEGWLTAAPTFPSDTRPYLANASQAGLEKQGWKQAFVAQRVQLADLRQPSNNPADSCVRVTVTVSKANQAVYTATRWFTETR